MWLIKSNNKLNNEPEKVTNRLIKYYEALEKNPHVVTHVISLTKKAI